MDPGELAKASPRKKFIWIIAVLVVVAALAAVLTQKAWYPHAQRAYYTAQAKSALSSERNTLKDPFLSLGFTNVNGPKNACTYGPEYGYSGTKLTCTSTLQSYTVLPASDQDRSVLNTSAILLAGLLVEDGWKSGTTPLNEWMRSLTAGADNLPDQFNYKHTGDMYCTLDYSVAYSKPKPAAMNVVMECATPESKPVAGRY